MTSYFSSSRAARPPAWLARFRPACARREGLTSTQPFSWKAGVLFVVTCGGLIWYFDYEKTRMQKKRIAEANKGIGKPLVGGSFDLVDQHGNRFTHEDLKGRYSLVRQFLGFLESSEHGAWY
jgi:hypothetical protein